MGTGAALCPSYDEWVLSSSGLEIALDREFTG
jgi:hypothetical protein